MKFFQIRISQHLGLEDFLKRLSNDICLKLMPFLPTEKNSEEYLLCLQECIQSSLRDKIEKFPNCGLAEECHEGVEGGPWLDYSDKIYMVYIEDTFEKKMNRTSSEIVNSYFYDLPYDARMRLSGQMEIVLCHEISKHLYFNPACRAIPFCELQL